MKSRFHILGHPIHVMLVSYPLALYTVALVCDLLFLWTGGPPWFQMAFWTMLFGLIGNLAANFSGIVDFLALLKKAPQAKQTAIIHLCVGWLLVALYGASLLLRNWGVTSDGGVSTAAIVLNLVGAACVGLQGWFGGELVYRHGIGITGGDK
jgi:uncharacterized membrane protein